MSEMQQDWRQRQLRAVPGRLMRPLGFLPHRLSQQGFIALCNQMFAAELRKGDLDFLTQRVLRLAVEDAGVEVAVTCTAGRLVGVARSQPADVCIRGTAYDFLLLASRREDPDTLFFQRRLRLEGVTELGLHLKNFLDAWEPPASVQFVQRIAGRGLELAEHLGTNGPT